MIIFYSHLISYASLMESLDGLDLSLSQKKELAKLIDSTLYHAILDLVLSNLSISDKKEFMILLQQKKSRQEIMSFLNKRVANIEGLILETAEKLKKELHEDIKDAKRIKK